MIHPAAAAEPEQPPVCSAATVSAGTAPKDFCVVTPLGDGHNEVKINLTAQTTPIEIAGYTVTTDNYNGKYLTPIVEALPGDTVAAHIVNILQPRTHGGMPPHGEHDWNPTNLHYFHGGIVTPNNARPNPAELGNGDNVYVYLRSDKDPQVKSNTFDLKVPIPGEGNLDARVLEDEKAGFISHPLGLNWYHSHLHGISSTQVMGGMSGLLSIGDATVNVKAACKKKIRLILPNV
jgi:FtsP/CotA-like multicopper oxidase with cupredoxin domain